MLASMKNEKKNLLIKVYVKKKSRNLGSAFLDFWQFFNFLTFQREAQLPSFYDNQDNPFALRYRFLFQTYLAFVLKL